MATKNHIVVFEGAKDNRPLNYVRVEGQKFPLGEPVYDVEQEVVDALQADATIRVTVEDETVEQRTARLDAAREAEAALEAAREAKQQAKADAAAGVDLSTEGEPPYPGYDDDHVEDVVAVLNAATDTEAEAIKKYEGEHKARTTILDWERPTPATDNEKEEGQ